jgi:hypothetical protein
VVGIDQHGAPLCKPMLRRLARLRQGACDASSAFGVD